MSERAELSKIIPSFTVYKFMTALVQPFTKFDAYKLGIIDSKGNFKKKFKELKTQKEKKAASMFFRIIINLKKLLAMIPSPMVKQKLRQLPTAMFLIKEEVEKVGGNGDEIERVFLGYVKEEYPEMYEEIANSMGGNFSSPQIGTPNPNLAGHHDPNFLGSTKKMKLIRRKKKDEEND
tara:strand:- start:80 stop:613 length:534 start_codon:yes stop_codon:yes gene_type:complete